MRVQVAAYAGEELGCTVHLRLRQGTFAPVKRFASLSTVILAILAS
jgi:hypothetical protein